MSKFINSATAGEVCQYLGLKVLNEGDMNAEISFSNIYRADFELAGHKHLDSLKSLVLWSGIESSFLDSYTSLKKIIDIISVIVEMHPPGIVVTEKFKYTNNLLKIAKRENVNVFYTNMASAEFTSAAETYISRKIAKYTIIHGAIVQIFGVGVLIKGESGVGKSELVMQLVDKGHIFIGDDAVDVARFGNILFGKTNKYADRFVEVKGLGMVDIEKVCGVQKMLPSCNIEMVIEIVDGSKQKNEFDRSRQQVKTTRICGINLPYYTVSRVAAIAENCVVDYKLRNAGHEPMINYNEHITNTEMEEK